MGVMACTIFLLQGRQLHNEESENRLSCTRHANWSSSSSLPNIIKLSQTVWELLPAQNFGIRGNNYILKTVRVVNLARNIPTGPLLHFYITLSKYVLGNQSYGLHKISASGEITTQEIKLRVVSLTRDMPTGPSLHPYQILSNYLKQYAQDFGFRGDNYIRKIVRVVSLARDTPTGSSLHSYQTLPKYL